MTSQYIEKGRQYGEYYFKNCKYTQLMQLVLSFVLGVIFAPYSYGFAFLIVYLLAYEFAYAAFTNLESPYWTPLFRVGIIAVTIFGWLIGRYIVGWRNPLRNDPNTP